MEKSYYMNNAAGAQHSKFDATMPSIPWNNGVNLVNSELNSSSYVDQYFAHLVESSLTSADDAFHLRELIAKQLGGGALSSAPNPRLPPILDHVGGSFGNSPLPPVPSVASDPGFAERAAKFSCFGSKSFNGRNMVAGAELSGRSDHFPAGNARLSRVSSSPALRHGGSPLEIVKNTSQLLQAASNGVAMGSSDKKSSSNEDSSVSTGSKKRKAASRVKSSKSNDEGEDEGGIKRTKPTESVKTETKTGPTTNDESEQKQKANQKTMEPPKDYIHVRARRGQATDSHSLAERVRREKISERMKLLQDLVPGCNKVTGKALMLDEIINYVQSLQRQVEFLSMKLATVNPGLELNVSNVLSKDVVFQENGTLQQQLYPMENDTSSTAFYHLQNVQQPQQNNNANASVDPRGIQFPSPTGFNEFPAFGEDDLQSIVHMGFHQNPVEFPDQTKIELR